MTRLEILNAQIPILEAKLKAMRKELRGLKLAETMRRLHQDPAYKAKAMAGMRAYWQSPEGRAKAKAKRPPQRKPLLPWPKDAPERQPYYNLRRQGWTREDALRRVNIIFKKADYTVGGIR